MNFRSRPGVWELNGADPLVWIGLLIPDAGDDTERKLVQIQLTYLGDPDVSVSATPDGPAGVPRGIPISEPLGGGWVHTTYEFKLAICPHFEAVIIRPAPDDTLFVDQVVVDTYCYDEQSGGIKLYGTALGSGDLAIRVLSRGDSCDAPVTLMSLTQQYDAVPGDGLPTTATEIRNAIVAGLVDYDFDVLAITAANGSPAVKITGPPFDVCVDGARVVSLDSANDPVTKTYQESGILITGLFLSLPLLLPGVSDWGKLVLAVLMLVGTVFAIRRLR